MAEHVLVPLDGSPLAERALRYTLESLPDATVTVLHVIDPIDSVYAAEMGGLPIAEDWYDAAQERTELIFEAARAVAAESDRRIETVSVVGRPPREILSYTDANAVDHVVMGSHGRKGLNRVFLGSVAEAVMRRSSVPVTVVR